MRLVVLDGYTLNPGDLDWSGLRALGECEIHERTPPGLVVARAQQAEIVLTNKTVLSREVLAQLPLLRYVGVLATGYKADTIFYEDCVQCHAADEIYCIGDAFENGQIWDAVRAGYHLALSI